MKKCSTCKTEKTLECFSKHRATKDGLSYVCKQCTNTKTRIWYLKNRERNHERSAKWWAANRERSLKKGRDRKTRYVKDNPIKRHAHIKITNAIALGKVQKQPCVICKKVCNKKSVAHAHHDDYSKPLAVSWLCRKHHACWHRLFIAEGSDESARP